MVQNWFTEPANESAKILSNSLIRLIARSTLIWRRAICCVSVTSLKVNCKEISFDKNGGIVNRVFLVCNIS